MENQKVCSYCRSAVHKNGCPEEIYRQLSEEITHQEASAFFEEAVRQYNQGFDDYHTQKHVRRIGTKSFSFQLGFETAKEEEQKEMLARELEEISEFNKRSEKISQESFER